MSESIVSIREQLWEKMRGSGGKEYRDSFVAAHLSTSVAAQIQTLREDRGWTKRQLAKKTGMAATRISLMESPSYDKFTLTTLRRLASAFDVALEARFVSFSWLVDWVSDLSPAKLSAANFDEDSLARVHTQATAALSASGISSMYGAGVTGNVLVQLGEDFNVPYQRGGMLQGNASVALRGSGAGLMSPPNPSLPLASIPSFFGSIEG